MQIKLLQHALYPLEKNNELEVVDEGFVLWYGLCRK